MTLFATLCALLVGLANPAPQQTTEFVIIVNTANQITTVSRELASRLFLKREARWPGGGDVQPIDLEKGSRVREVFTRVIHRRSLKAVESYWQQEIFSGGELPPPERTHAQVVQYVRDNAGAIGYVPSDTPLPSGVRVLRLAP
jgi:ABC-type phosphate transport system substrate-binding protein